MLSRPMFTCRCLLRLLGILLLLQGSCAVAYFVFLAMLLPLQGSHAASHLLGLHLCQYQCRWTHSLACSLTIGSLILSDVTSVWISRLNISGYTIFSVCLFRPVVEEYFNILPICYTRETDVELAVSKDWGGEVETHVV